ncbi:CYTH and CHAD domain-containing protein [Streptomyces sp. ODS28]|uniref:CYTH and CHAD domain-containing protein n=1 Tax=Streptomyces sp. ODS28 TaxID=3136688 RepID=UPI0031E6B16B
MAGVVREIERKYQAADGADGARAAAPPLPELGVPGVHRVVDAGTVDLDAVYYDTEDQRLAADGVTLRRRTGGEDAGWHLKLPVEPGVRDEVQAPPGRDAEVPRTLLSLVRSRLRGEPLVPTMRLRQERQRRRLLGPEGELLVEVVRDRVSAERFGPSGGTAKWTETECELAEGRDPVLLDRVEERLLAAGYTRAGHASKLARALEETAFPAERKDKRAKSAKKHRKTQQPSLTAADVVLGYADEQVRALVALDPAVRRDVPDSVHRMRVATRRLRSCFRSYGKVLDRAVTGPLGDELKWLAAELGVDRDQEVLAERLHTRVGELPRGLQLGPVRGRLRTFSHARRGGSRRRLIAVLDGRRYMELLTALHALLERPPLLGKAAESPPDKVVAAAVRRDFDRLAGHIGEALAAPPGETRDLALHEARKAAKRTRYSAEAARAVFGRRAREYAVRMTALQDLLGEHQDSVVAREALREIAVQAHAAGEPSFTYGVLYERECGLARECERELPVLWRSVASEEHRRLG